jgi:diguanylate cyclase (GGDEF)-like protein
LLNVKDNIAPLSLNELVAAVQYMPVGVTIVERSLALRFWNDAFCRLLDFPAELMQPGVTLEDMFTFNALRGEYGPGNPDDHVRERMELTRQFQPHHFVRTRPDGTVLDITGRVIYDDSGGMAGFVTIYRDLTFEKRQEQQVKAANKELVLAYDDLKQAQVGSMLLETDQHKYYQMATRDALTGLYNRYYLEDIAEHALQIQGRDAFAAQLLLIFRVDRFADINVRYGHVGRDAVMRRVAMLFAQHSPRFGFAARVGSGNFAVLAAVGKADECLAYAECIREAARDIRFEQTLAPLRVAVSATVVERLPGESFDDLLVRAGVE